LSGDGLLTNFCEPSYKRVGFIRTDSFGLDKSSTYICHPLLFCIIPNILCHSRGSGNPEIGLEH